MTLSIHSFLNFANLVKMCPIFDGSQSNSITWYQRILKGCSFGCKNLLNFACLTMKFHNCHCTTAGHFVTIQFPNLIRNTTFSFSISGRGLWRWLEECRLATSLWHGGRYRVGHIFWAAPKHICVRIRSSQ